MELDSTAASTLKEEDNIVNVRVVAKDLVRKVRFGIQVMLVAIEEQSDIHYAMPLKVLNGDAALYDKQWSGIRREHKRKERPERRGIHLRFRKRRSPNPGIQRSTVLWRAGVGRTALPEGDDGFQYPPGGSGGEDCGLSVHLIDVRRYPHAERFRTDLKLVFGFLQRASEPEELTEFIEENTKEFSSLTEDAYDMIASMSKTGELKGTEKRT